MRAISRAALGILLVALCVSTSSCASEIILSAGRVVRIILNPLSATIRVGNRISVTAIPADSVGQPVGNASVTWSSSRTTVASVDAVGDVTGVSPGTATITASTGALSAALAVTVTDVAVASVSIAPTSSSIPLGNTVQLSATVRDSSGAALTNRVVTWESSNALVGNVSSTGLVTGVGTGTTTITATSESQSGTATVTVTAITPPPTPVATVQVLPGSASVRTGQTTQLSVVLRDAAGNALTGRTVTWGSSNAGTASVSSTGLVTGVAGGTATITATSEGQSGTATVTVTVPVATVSVSPAPASVQAGQTVQLTATTRDAGGTVLTGRVITWSTSNANVATVSNAGLVTGVVAGTATITATSEGRAGTSTVTVTAPPPVPVATVSVAPASPSVQTGQTVQLTATTRDAGGAVLTGRVITWATSNAGVATVSSAGLVTGLSAGTATITATSEVRSGQAVVTVTVPPPPAPVAT